ncbi:hypothetical protein [Fodinibacter luteus]
MTTDLAMTAVRETCERPWRGADTTHAGTGRAVQGRTVPFAGSTRCDVLVTDVRPAGVVGATPITGVVYPRLEAPPV